MPIGEQDNAKFIRRRTAAIDYMQQLLEQGELSDKQAIIATTDKFGMCPSVRDDYRIFIVLCDLIGG